MCFINIHTHHFDENNPCILSCSPNTYDKERRIFPEVMISSGIHPWYIQNNIEDDLQELSRLAESGKIVAIGECGLDIHSEADKNLQEDIFIRQIELSEKYRKPVIIHCVKMHNELIRLKKQLKPFNHWIIHGYRGNIILTEQLLQHDFYFSFGKNFNPESLRIIPIDRIFAETDDVDVSIRSIYENIGNALNISSEKLIRQIKNNFSRIFEQKDR